MKENEEEEELVRRAALVALRRTFSNEGVQVIFDEQGDESDKALVRQLSNKREHGDDDADSSPSKDGVSDFKVFAGKFALTGMSAMVAESATFPVDLTKTRMQLSTTGSSFFGTAISIVRTEGVTGLYAGIAPAVARHIPYSGIRVGLYENLRKQFIKEGETPSFFTKLALGFTSGGIAQTVAVPCDLVKIRMVADGQLPKHQRRYKGLVDAFLKIPKETGSVAGLWAGSKPAIVRAAMVNLGELATYDTAKRFVLSTGIVGDNMFCHVLSAMCSGFFASIVSCPADVVKSRIMNDPTKYRGMVDCTIQTVRNEGIFAMWKGFFPAWARLGPWQLTFWVTYEQLLKVLGMESF